MLTEDQEQVLNGLSVEYGMEGNDYSESVVQSCYKLMMIIKNHYVIIIKIFQTLIINIITIIISLC